jgi:hypothetical protein
MNNEKYSPNELPESATLDLVIWYGISGWEAGEIGVYSFDFKGDTDKVVLCKKQVTFSIPKQGSLKEKVLDALNEEKNKILAENHKRLKGIQDKIDNLLAIEYQPGE